jgi:hypothetical protein
MSKNKVLETLLYSGNNDLSIEVLFDDETM